MSYLTAFFIACAVITVVTPLLLWQIHRAWRAEQAKNSDPYDVGPDALHLLGELDTHLDEYAAADPELRAAFGPTTNHPTGDQP